MDMKLCCYFNYPPLYRASIYKAIDEVFDTQFYFGREVVEGEISGIAKLDGSIFKRQPIEFENKVLFGKFLWRTKAVTLALKPYDTFLITGDVSYSYIPFLLLCRLFRKRVYAWGHGFKIRKGISRMGQDFMMYNLTGFFTYGENGRARMIELGYPADKIHVIYNSLQAKIENPISYQSNIYTAHFKNTNPTIIFIGRLTKNKRLDKIVTLLERLEQEYRVLCNVVFVGDGAYKDELKSLTCRLSLSNRVWFYGECYDEERNCELLYNADLCLSPGNVGLTALHAMQYGTPVISQDDFESQMPEYETIVPYKTGLLFRKNDYEDCALKIKKWLDFAMGKRERIRQYCYDMINGKWNSDYQIKIFERVFNNE